MYGRGRICWVVICLLLFLLFFFVIGYYRSTPSNKYAKPPKLPCICLILDSCHRLSRVRVCTRRYSSDNSKSNWARAVKLPRAIQSRRCSRLEGNKKRKKKHTHISMCHDSPSSSSPMRYDNESYSPSPRRDVNMSGYCCCRAEPLVVSCI